jgi:hypothetical protein
MNDTISTAKAKAELTFEDKTTVKLTEHSKMIIDDFVYDPKKGSGKLAINMALGTARYASGQIAKNNPQQVAIKTPTASIAVRGTDFSMTVDELGRSLIMLLPSCDPKGGCVTGAIEVSNLSGVVLLDVPYQATLVNSLSSPPSTPTIIKIDQANINNMLIISKPPEVHDVVQAGIAKKEKSILDFNALDVDLLKYSKLDENKLDNNQALDRNDLNADLLDFIDVYPKKQSKEVIEFSVAKFQNLVGLELRPRLIRDATTFWKYIHSNRIEPNSVWSHLDFLPDRDDLTNPALYVEKRTSE